MFKVRKLNNKDYDKLVEWWNWFRFPVPSRECLPDNGECGLMISKDGIEIGAGFIYFTNSSMAWIEFIVSNPKYKNKDRQLAIETLIVELTEICRSKGCKVIFTSIKNENLINRFTAAGWAKGSIGTTEMVFKL